MKFPERKIAIQAKRNFFSKGITLVEILVSIFILSLILFSITSIFTAISSSKIKSNSISWVKENADYAMSSIAKDVRMGKIEKSDPNCLVTGVRTNCLMITRNRDLSKVCYRISADGLSLGIAENLSSNSCPADGSSVYKKIIDLTGRNMTFDGGTSGFYVSPTDTETVVTAEKSRGWVEMNFNIRMTVGKEMEADEINLQTSVSSRDYGWEEVAP